MKLLAKFGKWLQQIFGSGCAEPSDPPGFDAQQIENNVWRQGSLLSIPMVEHSIAKGLLPVRPNECIWCVLTQDCDLVLSSEPKVEVVFARHVDKPNKGYTWSKTARELHLRDESLEQSLASLARDRETIPRWQLCNFQPSEVSLS